MQSAIGLVQSRTVNDRPITEGEIVSSHNRRRHALCYTLAVAPEGIVYRLPLFFHTLSHLVNVTSVSGRMPYFPQTTLTVVSPAWSLSNTASSCHLERFTFRLYIQTRWIWKDPFWRAAFFSFHVVSGDCGLTNPLVMYLAFLLHFPGWRS